MPIICWPVDHPNNLRSDDPIVLFSPRPYPGEVGLPGKHIKLAQVHLIAQHACRGMAGLACRGMAGPVTGSQAKITLTVKLGDIQPVRLGTPLPLSMFKNSVFEPSGCLPAASPPGA